MKKITFPVPSRMAGLTMTLHPNVKNGYYRKAGYWKCLKQILSYNAENLWKTRWLQGYKTKNVDLKYTI